VWSAVAAAHRKAVAAGSGVVLVHGGGAQVDAHLARLGMGVERVEGRRVTPREQIGEVVAVLAGKVNTAIVGALNSAGARAVGLSLGDGGLTRSEAIPAAEVGGVDLGRVGRVTGGDGRLVATLVAAGYLPVVSSIGIDAAGEALNINADEAAAALAGIVGASRLVLLTDVPGVRGADGSTASTLTLDEIESMIAVGVISGGMIPKARSAAASAEASGTPTLIATWADAAVLAAMADEVPSGTLVLPRRRSGAAV